MYVMHFTQYYEKKHNKYITKAKTEKMCMQHYDITSLINPNSILFPIIHNAIYDSLGICSRDS